LHRSTRSGIS